MVEVLVVVLQLFHPTLFADIGSGSPSNGKVNCLVVKQQNLVVALLAADTSFDLHPSVHYCLAYNSSRMDYLVWNFD